MLRSMSRWPFGAVFLVSALACSRGPARPSTATATATAAAAAFPSSPAPPAEAAVTSRWVYPLPQGNSLTALWLSPQGDVYAVGDGGTILRWSAAEQRFSVLQLGGADLLAIWGNEEGIYVAGELGALLVSRDRGQSWKQVESGSKAHWRALSGCGRELWAVGSAGQFARSLDSGVTWQVGRVPNAPEPTAAPSVLYSAADLIGVICDENGQVTTAVHSGALLRSRDGGATWTRLEIEPAQLGSVAHPDRAHGLAFVKLLRAHDELLIVSLVGVPARGEKLPAKRWAHVLSVRGNRVAPWRVAQQLEREVDRSFDAAPIGARSLVVTSSRQAALVTESGTYWSGPDDVSWHDAALNPTRHEIGMESEPMNDVAGDERALYAVGVWGSILKSTDAGRQWQRLRSPVDRFRAIWTNGKEALAAGQGITTSSDGGNTWSAPKRVAGKALLGAESVWGVERERYIAAHAGLFHSADGGATFKSVPLALEGRVRAAGVWGTAKDSVLVTASVHEPVGATRTGVILRGSVAGFRVVFELTPSPTGNFTALHGNAERRAYAGGVGGLFLRSLDGGITWERLPTLGEKDGVCGLHAGRGDVVWALTGAHGCRGTRLWVSRDAGKTFNELASPRDSKPVSAIGGSPLGELVVATAGRLYERDVKTETFNELTAGAYAASTPLVAIAAPSPRRLLAVGDHGTILLVGPER
jgi:photosystem II stability/assembly factor-like uncharacterized protein